MDYVTQYRQKLLDKELKEGFKKKKKRWTDQERNPTAGNNERQDEEKISSEDSLDRYT